MRGPWWVLLIGALACEEPAPTLDMQTQSLTRPSQAPEVGVDLEDGGTWVSPGTLSGYAVDAEQAPATLPLRVESAVDGVLVEGNPDGDGQWVWQGELTPGPNPLLITAVDREGNETALAVLAQVRPNRAPSCVILSPLDGTEVAVRTDLRFQADVADVDGDPLDVLWRSDLDGGLGIGLDFTRRLRVPGVHQITIEVNDPYGATCTDRVQVTVVD